ncbi:hypothetical protein PENNAL_c0103G10527 [Penicillium nalgiovense]|uniref:Uncharacterized protein n=1 Tax=Penicillium nalgiovense TaxID=60175 RepID=A0A1V6X928_PENNA|nr:hypothetical protein PENNAL_c0103G10527 [Penicillium nalgiovense]
MGTQPTFASRKPTFTQATGSRTSQVLPEEKSRLHITPVSKQFSLPALHRLLYSSSTVSGPDNEPTMELKHSGAITEIGSSTGAIGGQHTSTRFDGHSLLPNEDSERDVTGFLQNVTSKATLSPATFDGSFEQVSDSADILHFDSSSGPFVESTHSTSQQHTEDSEAGETGQSRILKTDRLSGTEWSGAIDRITGTTGHHLSQASSDKSQTLSRTLTGTAAGSQTISQTFGPTSAANPSDAFSEAVLL